MNNPELYAKFTSRITGALNNSILQRYLKNVKFRKEAVSILDIGTADGSPTVDVLLPKIPKKCKELVGIDIAQQMIDYSSKVYQRPELKFVKMDITEKNIPAEFRHRFDHAFSFLCLHLVPNKRAFLQNLFQMLAPDGDFLGTYFIKAPFFTTFMKMSNYPSYQQMFPKDLIQFFENIDTEVETTPKMLKETGFASYFCEPQHKAMAWKSVNDFRGTVLSVDPIIPTLFSNEREKYVDEFVKQIREDEDMMFVPDENGQEMVIGNLKILVMYASKV